MRAWFRSPLYRKHPHREAGNIFFMLMAAVALVGAMTVGAGNVVKGIVTSMSDVTRKTVAEEKMQAGARLSIMDAAQTQTNSGDCDTDGYVEPLPSRDPAGKPAPVNGGLVPENIGAETKDPWGTEYGYCAWDLGSVTVSDNNAGCGGNTARRLNGTDAPTGTAVAIISAGKDRKFSTTCNDATGAGSLPSGVVSWWKFDEGAGTTAADTISGNNGTLVNGPTWTTGHSGGALQFDGTNDYVNAGSSASLDNLRPMTICAWIYPTSLTNAFQMIMDKSTHTYDGPMFYVANGGYNNSFGYFSGGTEMTASTRPIILANQWQNVCASYDGTVGPSGIKIYYNGSLVSATQWNNGGPDDDSAHDFIIGLGGDLAQHGFQGKIDDLIIFNRVLTDPEIAQVMNGSGGTSSEVTKADGSDDIVMKYTYNDANNLSGDDLWKIKDTKPGTATIDKNLDITGGADLLGPLNLMKSGLILPDDSATGACDATTDQQLRINFTSNPPVLEICDFTGGNGWAAVSVGSSGSGAADCTGLGDAHYNDVASGHCYYRIDGSMTWDDAQTACQADSAYLAVLSSSSENTMVWGNLGTTSYPQWLGANENTVMGDWRWKGGELDNVQFWTGEDAGSAVGGNYNNWEPGEPNLGSSQTCLQWGWAANGTWDDNDCGATHAAICEKTGPGPGGGGNTTGLCDGVTNPGDTCANGDVYVGTLTGYHYYTSKCDYGQTWDGSSCTGTRTKLPWNNGNNTGGVFIGVTNDWTGAANTATIVATDSNSTSAGVQPHQAAQACDSLSLNGSTDWYLPASDELKLMYLRRTAIGNFATDDFFWSSTESHSASEPLNARRLRFSDGYEYVDGDGKPLSQYVRCLRRSVAAAASGSGTAPTSGLVAYWPFSTSGNASEDASGNNHVMNYGMGAGGGQIYEFEWTAAGKFGGGAVGDGSPDGMSIDHAADLNTTSFTISAWINPAVDGVERNIMNKWAPDYKSPYWLGLETDGTFTCGLSLNNAGNYTEATSAMPIATNTWTHIACTYDNTANQIVVYINGIEDARISTPAGTPDSTTTPLWMGWLDEFGGGETFEGTMDEVRIYNRALSSSEIVDLYSDTGAAIPTAFTPDLFLTDPQVKQCTSAGLGPFQLTGVSDFSNYYRSLELYNGYLFSGGYNSGFSVFKPNGDGTVTRLLTKNSSGGDTAGGIYYDGTYYYVGNGYNELAAYTFDGTTMTEVGAIDTPGYSWDLDGFGGYLFVADTDAIRAYTFDGSTFTFVAEQPSGHEVFNVWTDGRYIYAAENNAGLHIYTFNGSAFTEVASAFSAEGFIEETTGDGKYIYADAVGGISVYSFDGRSLMHLGDYDNDGTSYLRSIFTDGANIYAAWENGVLEALRFNGTHFESLRRIDVPDIVSAIRSDGQYLYVAFENSPMRIYSGFECYTGNNMAPGLGARAANPYIGKIIANYTGGCGIKPDGSAWCWGGGSDGQLGNGTTTGAAVSPQRVRDQMGYVQVTGGSRYNCGIRTDGSGWCWGDDQSGRLGNGTPTTDQTTPSAITGTTAPSGGYRWSKIAAGETHTCGILYSGSMYCWGNNGYGQLGGGTTGGTSPTPILVIGGKKWIDVSAGPIATCGIDYRGAMWCWGDNDEGQLGTGENVANPENDPTMVRDPGPWVKVATGDGQICGIKADGSLWCWGDAYDGAIGQYDPGFVFSIPIPSAEPGPWVDVSVSNEASNASCAVKQDGTAWCWGTEQSGHFGNGSTATGNQFLPVRVSDPGPWATISVSGSHTCGMKTDGSAWCWGGEAVGELGNGSVLTGTQHLPTPVIGFPSAAPWSWDDIGTATVATGTANISVGTIGYAASGLVNDCSAMGGDTYYNDPATGHCYFRSSSASTWAGGQAECAKLGGYLATITSEAEQRALNAGIGTAREVWIGASDAASDGSWYYTGGELAGTLFWSGTQTGNPQNNMYNNWSAAVEPNGTTTENCAAMYLSAATNWNDSNCGNSKRYLCEFGTAGNGGGLSFGTTGTNTLRQYNAGSELLLETQGATTSSQLSWKTGVAGNATRSLGIDYQTGALELGKNTSSVDDWMHAISPQFEIGTDGNVAIGTHPAYNKLEINGGLRVGNDTGACTIQRAGTLRYVSGVYEYCNGSAWTTF